MRNNVLLTVFWLAALAVNVAPLYYWVLYWNDSNLRSNAAGSWFGTIIGVIVGVPIALYLARVQQRVQDYAKEAQLFQEQQTQREALRRKLSEELTYDLEIIKHLLEVLRKSPSGRKDVWEWAERVVLSLEFVTWHSFELLASTSDRLKDTPERLAYRNLKRLTIRVEEAEKANAFFLGCSGDQLSADKQIDDVRHMTESVESDIKSALDSLAISTK